MNPHTPPVDERRGNYSLLMGSLIVVVVGFAAFAVDISLITMAELQAQATADAASHAALIAFRENYSVSEGNAAAGFIMNVDKVAMGNAVIDPGYPQYGQYDFDLRTFTPGLAADGSANAVRVQVSRKGGNAVDLLLAPMLGFETADVSATAITAQQMRAIMLVQDMSCSMMDGYPYRDPNAAVNQGRVANLVFLEYLWQHPQEGDKLGLTMFAQYANTAPTSSRPFGRRTNDFMNPSTPPWAPLMDIESNYPLLKQRINGICNTYAAQPCPLSGANHPKWDDIGTCTNPEPALGQAVTQLMNYTDRTYFRGIVFFSDGVPNCNAGGWWDGTAISRAYAQADRAWNEDISIWTILYHNGYFDPSFMEDLVRGIGFAQTSPNPADLPGMYEEVAKSLPTALVE